MKATPSTTSVNSTSRGSSPVQATDSTSTIITVAQVVRDSLVAFASSLASSYVQNEAVAIPPPISPPNTASSQDVTFDPPPGLECKQLFVKRIFFQHRQCRHILFLHMNG